MLKRKNWSIGGKQNNNCVTRSLLWSSSRPDFSPDEEKKCFLFISAALYFPLLHIIVLPSKDVLCCITQPPWLIANAAHGKRCMCARVGCLPALWYDTLDKTTNSAFLSFARFPFSYCFALGHCDFSPSSSRRLWRRRCSGEKNFTCDHTPWHPQLQRLSIFETV